MNRGILFALLSALLFGVSTPLAKLLGVEMAPLQLAAVLYLGSGLGLLGWRAVARGGGASLARRDLPWLTGAILAGGVLAPVLLLWGLQRMAGAHAALLLNLESVFTALLAWTLFGENFDRRIVLGMVFIVGGSVVLGGSGVALGGEPFGVVAVVLACLLWGLDNNLTRHVAGADPISVAGWKGVCAGGTNLLLASLVVTAPWPGITVLAAAALVGLLGYGISLVLFVRALGALGTARTGAYFGVAPFAGAAAAFLLLNEQPTAGFGLGLILMAAGVWLHLSERHDHTHRHEPLEHTHAHVHDDHHQHRHDFPWSGAEPHTHPHHHPLMVHSHPHYPDLHHRHTH